MDGLIPARASTPTIRSSKMAANIGRTASSRSGASRARSPSRLTAASFTSRCRAGKVIRIGASPSLIPRREKSRSGSICAAGSGAAALQRKHAPAHQRQLAERHECRGPHGQRSCAEERQRIGDHDSTGAGLLRHRHQRSNSSIGISLVEVLRSRSRLIETRDSNESPRSSLRGFFFQSSLSTPNALQSR